MAELETLYGTIERFIYQSEDNGFSVFLLQARHSKAITVKGYIPHIQEGQEVQLQGTWVFHAKFGKQFEAHKCISSMPTTVVGLKKYLGSGLIKGIGPVYAEKLVNHFGNEILTIIDTQPERLHEVDGIGEKRINQIVEAWKDQKEISNLMVFLQERGITPALAVRIYKHYKHEALAVLHENPYRLADEVWGVGFKTADEVALKMGFHIHSPQRVAAGILFAISTVTTGGHLYVELQDLKKKTIELLELSDHEELIKKALHTLYNSDKIKLLTENEVHYITLSAYYFSEKGIARRINLLLNRPTDHGFEFDEIYKTLRSPKEGEIYLNEDQQKGILSCIDQKITIITGGPGTGKTTIIKKLLNILDSYNVDYKLTAPTGRAAKRIIEGTGRFATTIHRLLEFDPTGKGFTYNETHALKLDYLIVDEASMLDVFLAHALLKALPRRLISFLLVMLISYHQ